MKILRIYFRSGAYNDPVCQVFYIKGLPRITTQLFFSIKDVSETQNTSWKNEFTVNFVYLFYILLAGSIYIQSQIYEYIDRHKFCIAYCIILHSAQYANWRYSPSIFFNQNSNYVETREVCMYVSYTLTQTEEEGQLMVYHLTYKNPLYSTSDLC